MGNSQNVLKLKNRFLNNIWVKKEIKIVIKFGSNENKTKTYENVEGTAKTILRRKFMVLNVLKLTI